MRISVELGEAQRCIVARTSLPASHILGGWRGGRHRWPGTWWAAVRADGLRLQRYPAAGACSPGQPARGWQLLMGGLARASRWLVAGPHQRRRLYSLHAASRLSIGCLRHVPCVRRRGLHAVPRPEGLVCGAAAGPVAVASALKPPRHALPLGWAVHTPAWVRCRPHRPDLGGGSTDLFGFGSICEQDWAGLRAALRWVGRCDSVRLVEVRKAMQNQRALETRQAVH